MVSETAGSLGGSSDCAGESHQHGRGFRGMFVADLGGEVAWACGVSLPLLTILHSVHHLHYCKVRWIKVRELTYST